jgi:hypothetical protein
LEKLASDVVEAASRLDNVFEDVKLSVDEDTEYSVSRPPAPFRLATPRHPSPNKHLWAAPNPCPHREDGDSSHPLARVPCPSTRQSLLLSLDAPEHHAAMLAFTSM